MTTRKQLLDLQPKTMLRLSEVERLIRIHRIVVPPLSRHALIALCEDGTFETAPRRTTRGRYLVSEASFLEWVRDLNKKE